MNARVRTKRPAFTLIEVLVVIAIISLLIAILLPSAAVLKRQARRIVCQSNLRELARGVSIFGHSKKDLLPTTVQRADVRERPDLAANILFHRPLDFDLARELDSFSSPTSLNCPEARRAQYRPASPDVTTVYSNYLFLWGAVTGTPEEGYRSVKETSPTSLVAADLTWNVYRNRGLTFGGNHLRPGHYAPRSRFVLSEGGGGVGAQYLSHVRRPIYGMNAGFFDGSVRWVECRRRAWRGTGPFHQGEYRNARVYLPAWSECKEAK